MQTQTVQLRVTLPVELQTYLQDKARQFGLNMSSYVKNLILSDVKETSYPIMKASEKTEESYKIAIRERNKAIKADDLDSFFDNL